MILTIGASGVAQAHASYLRSDPAPNAHLATSPTRVLVGFSEKVQVSASGLVLLDQDGREVARQSQPTGDSTELSLPLPLLADGVYTVAWHTVSAEDGDPAKGYFAFAVGTTPAPSAPPVTQTGTQDGITVSLAVSPDIAGKNGYQATAKRGDAALANVTRVRLRITPLDRDIGQSEIVLTLASSGGGTYGGSGFELPFAGRYRIQVQVRRSDSVDDLAFDFDLRVISPASSPSSSVVPSNTAAAPTAFVTPAPVDEPIVPPGTLLLGGVLALTVAIGAVLFARRRT